MIPDKHKDFVAKYERRDRAIWSAQEHRVVIAFSENENIPLGAVEGTYLFRHPVYTDTGMIANYLISAPDRKSGISWVILNIVVDLGYKRESFKFRCWITPAQDLEEVFELCLYYANTQDIVSLIAKEGAWG